MSGRSNEWSTRRPLILGISALMFLVLSIGVWSTTVSISGAVVVAGELQLEEKQQAIQHPDGGVIAEILVRDGDTVFTGDILIKLDDSLLGSELTVVREQLYEISARTARLKAERDGVEVVEFSLELLEGTSSVAFEFMLGQEELFTVRQEILVNETKLLMHRRVQISSQIRGQKDQVLAFEKQKALVESELDDEAALQEKGLSQISRTRALQRELARLEGNIGEYLADITENMGLLSEMDTGVSHLRTQQREEAITTLRDLRYREIELREREVSLRRAIQKMEIRAPVAGVIYNSRFHTPRSVVRPAEALLNVVPQGALLVVISRVSPRDVGDILIGQKVEMKFAAFDKPKMQEWTGRVENISPDVFTDDRTGERFYLIEVHIKDNIGTTFQSHLLPGMPVEVFFKTDAGTPMEYLIDPLTSYFTKAFRDS